MTQKPPLQALENIVRAAGTHPDGANIEQIATAVSKQDQGRFIEMVETQLLTLTGGNIARHRLRPLEYERWKQNWN